MSCFRWISACLGLAWACVHGVAAEPAVPGTGLRWGGATNLVDAQITGWPLTKVLGRVARATGWEVFLEPGTDRAVNATFTGLPPRDALGRLLGGLSFSLQPQPAGPARLYIYRTDRDRATQRLEDPAKPGRIANELVVRLRPGAKISIEELARQLGGRVLGKVDKFNAYRLGFDTPEAAEAARRKLAELPEIGAVEDNYRWEAPEALAAAGEGRPGGGAATLRPKLNPDGKNLVAGIIDTAVQPLAADREALILSRTDLVSGRPADDSLWHGTAMTETFFQGLALTDSGTEGTGVRVRLYNTYGANETATSFDVARAAVQAAQDGVSVLSVSLGGPQRSPLLDDVLGSFVQQGGQVLVAAGNEGSGEPFYPAAAAPVIAVTAVNRDGQPMPWANWGSYVDVGAPGVSLVPYGGMTWQVSGTSPATALTAGMAAGYVDRTGQPLSSIRPVLQKELPFKPAGP